MIGLRNRSEDGWVRPHQRRRQWDNLAFIVSVVLLGIAIAAFLIWHG